MKVSFASPLTEVPRNKNDVLFNQESEGEGIIRWFGERLGGMIRKAAGALPDTENIEEIRLRINQPVLFRTGTREYFCTSAGQTGTKNLAYIVKREDLLETLEKMTFSSVYAAEEELRQGFLTLPGGHRVGLSGETVVEHGKIRIMRHISALNIRLARQPEMIIPELLGLLINQENTVCHTLLVSPPRAGKTTMLRFLVKNLSNGVPQLNLKGHTVGVVDERSEIAGMWQGIPSFDLGCRTDVLDRCPKAQGLIMLIRSMAPEVVAVDELGGREDAAALGEAVRCGVKILATVHAGSLDELQKRAHLRELLNRETFERIVVLSRANGPGTVETVYDMASGVNLFNKPSMASRH
ncbi:Stage III sporulation protein AA [Dehalobacter sp. UNSWDHB]|uniref:stage III sporulation protein AA n=1 Tax=unclassified Dehalobacter TaxID=2635733 RepID=UPI00028ADF39|nr:MULTISPECIES: stage III sporulation protein AA [unclassified Dehalobacter]AFV01468.1 Stage III sporulation protein AA [Dehalobacter sp. DCA]AFV04505.1 Stage III sporulation protein AA [Dehalobacter sp. CF]EQB20565.1 Stage III sporulation protein AA [Dehalobacter sp. UNSWDHB]